MNWEVTETPIGLRFETQDVVLWCGNSREILPHIEHADCMATDPPYGIKGSSGTVGKDRAKGEYGESFEDTPRYVRDTCVPVVRECVGMCGRGVLTPGNRCFWMYPPPQEIGGLYQPATKGLGPWGRVQMQPVYFYGRDPRIGKRIADCVLTVTGRPSCSREEFPCAKPDAVADWMVHRASLDGEIVIDPFMGSGTIGMACVRLGRKFIGIELDRRHFDLAVRRIGEQLHEG